MKQEIEYAEHRISALFATDKGRGSEVSNVDFWWPASRMWSQQKADIWQVAPRDENQKCRSIRTASGRASKHRVACSPRPIACSLTIIKAPWSTYIGTRIIVHSWTTMPPTYVCVNLNFSWMKVRCYVRNIWISLAFLEKLNKLN